MFELARAAGSDGGEARGVRDGGGENEVVAFAGAVAEAGGREHGARAEVRHLAGEFDGIGTGGGSAAVDVDFALRGERGIGVGVDGNDDAPAAEFADGLGDEVGVAEGGGGNGNLGGAGFEGGFDVGDGTNASADGHGNFHGGGDAGENVEERAAVFDGGVDVEEAELVGPGGLVGGGAGDGVAGIDDVDEMDALDDAAFADVEAGHDGNGLGGDVGGAHGCPFFENGGEDSMGRERGKAGKGEWDAWDE